MKLKSLSLFAVILAAALAAQAQTAYRWTDKNGKVNYADKPPPADAQNVQQKKLGSANFVDTSGPSYSAQKAEQDYPVTLYTSVDCETECAIARDFLNRRSVSFSEKTIKTLDDSKAFKKVTGINDLAVPTLLVGARVEKGYQENAWNKLLDAAGYPHIVATPLNQGQTTPR